MKPISTLSYNSPLSSPKTPVLSPDRKKLSYTSPSPILGPIEERLAAENELSDLESRTESMFTRFRQAADNLTQQRHTRTYPSFEDLKINTPQGSSHSPEYDEINELERLPPPKIPFYFKDRLDTLPQEGFLFSECPEADLSASYVEYRNSSFLNFKKTVHEILSKTKNNEKTQEILEEEDCLRILEQDSSETFENQRDMIGHILDLAPQYRDLFLFAASTSNYSEGIEFLVRDCGINPDIQNEAGDTALHIAIEAGALRAVRILLECGANPHLPNKAGITPAHQGQGSKDIDIQDVFSKERSRSDRFAAFKIQIQNTLGETENDEKIKSILNKDRADDVYAYDEMIKEIAEVSREYAPTLLFAAAQADYAEGIEFIVYNLNTDINTTDAFGNTALHTAVAFCSINTIETLLGCGASFLQQNSYGQSSADLVIEIGRPSIRALFSDATSNGDEFGNTLLHNAVKSESIENIEKLLMLGADVDAQNIYGNTSLHIAVDFRSIDIIKMLLKYEASQDIRNYAGHSPLDLAQMQDDDDLFDAFFR